MFALRNFSRSVPRSAARLSAKAFRPQASLFRPVVAFQPSCSHAVPRLTASFHISVARRQESDTQQELVAKLQSEITMEQDQSEDADLSANIKEYLENSPFEIEDKPGHQEVTLTRTFGNEKIRVTFTTADLNNTLPNDEMSEYDNEVDDVIGDSANTKGAINQGATRDGNIRVAPEDRIAPADREDMEDEYDEEAEQGFPAHASIRVEKPGKGALAIEATAQDGDFIIEEVLYFPAADLADPATAEKDWQRRTLYTGPPFSNLDEDLQILLEKYLEERGINTRMALFIPDYIDHKEQKEYVSWLGNLKKFVE